MVKRKTLNWRLVHNTETVLDMKKRILNRSGIAVYQQKLKYGNTELLADANTLASYGVRPVDVVNIQVVQRIGVCICEDCNRMREKIKVRIQNVRGDSFTLEVTREDTVLRVKKQIQKKEHIPPSQQRLVFREQILEDDSIQNSYELVKNSEQEPHEDADESIPNRYNLVDLAVRPGSIPIPTIQLVIRSTERHSDNVFQRLLHMWGRG
jgi:hypothetical protein